MNDEYVKTLEATIRKMLEPIKGIPFDLVMQVLTGYRVLPFELADKNHSQLLPKLMAAALEAGRAINSGLTRERANEAGNAVEGHVMTALRNQGLNAVVPQTQSGRRKSAGYPDIAFPFANQVYYLECKTYTPDTYDSSLRTFYFSPSDQMKVTADAVHFLLTYETSQVISSRGYNFHCEKYKLISLEKLSLDLKYEFNSNNKRMYSGIHGAPILAEGLIL